MAAKIAAAYPKIRCALAAGVHASDTLYADFGFPTSKAYLDAFTVQADANPAWARKLVADATAKPCVDLPAPATPSQAAPAAGTAPEPESP